MNDFIIETECKGINEIYADQKIRLVIWLIHSITIHSDVVPHISLSIEKNCKEMGEAR